jgi:hypothetical protein
MIFDEAAAAAPSKSAVTVVTGILCRFLKAVGGSDRALRMEFMAHSIMGFR